MAPVVAVSHRAALWRDARSPCHAVCRRNITETPKWLRDLRRRSFKTKLQPTTEAERLFVQFDHWALEHPQACVGWDEVRGAGGKCRFFCIISDDLPKNFAAKCFDFQGQLTSLMLYVVTNFCKMHLSNYSSYVMNFFAGRSEIFFYFSPSQVFIPGISRRNLHAIPSFFCICFAFFLSFVLFFIVPFFSMVHLAFPLPWHCACPPPCSFAAG